MSCISIKNFNFINKALCLFLCKNSFCITQKHRLFFFKFALTLI